MADRIPFQDTLEQILGSDEVYFQPPPNVKMKYPAIIYSLNDISVKSANDSSYLKHPSYEVVLIDANPDSEYVDEILKLPYCSFDRSYKSDNLNHFVFIIYN